MSNMKLTSLTVAAPCPVLPSAAPSLARVAAAEQPGLSALSLGGARLRSAGLPDVTRLFMRECGMSGLAVSAAAGRGISERPTQAPAVAVAQAHAYATANGAETRNAWADGNDSALIGGAAIATKTQQTKRAFRGLEPWRDPA